MGEKRSACMRTDWSMKRGLLKTPSPKDPSRVKPSRGREGSDFEVKRTPEMARSGGYEEKREEEKEGNYLLRTSWAMYESMPPVARK